MTVWGGREAAGLHAMHYAKHARLITDERQYKDSQWALNKDADWADFLQ